MHYLPVTLPNEIPVVARCTPESQRAARQSEAPRSRRRDRDQLLAISRPKFGATNV